MNSLMRFARKAGRRMSLPPRLRLSIANVLDVAASAAQHDVSRNIARRVAGAVGHRTLRLQALRLKSFMHYLESRPPDWACAHLMWDETGERLVVDLLGNKNNVFRGVAGRGKVTLASQESLWHVFVARASVSWGWAANFESPRVQLMFPPLPLTSTIGEALWSGLVLHDAVAAFSRVQECPPRPRQLWHRSAHQRRRF
jgi:hypothetical protein